MARFAALASRQAFLRLLLVLVAANGLAAVLAILVGFGALGKTFLTSVAIVWVVLQCLYIAKLSATRWGWGASFAAVVGALQVALLFPTVWLDLEWDAFGDVMATCSIALLVGVLASFLARRAATPGQARASAASFAAGAALAAVAVAWVWGLVDLEGLMNQVAAVLAILMVTSAIMAVILGRMVPASSAPAAAT